MTEETTPENTRIRKSANKGLQGKITDGLNGIPPILACTAGAYLLDVSGCIEQVSKTLPHGLNFGYHLAAGSGLYGGYIDNQNRKVTSLLTLTASFIPEIIQFAHEGNLNKIGTACGVKAVGYGLGYIIGLLIKNV